MSIIDTVKDAVKLAQQFDNVEFIQTIMQLQQEAYDLAEENRRLRDTVRELDEQQKTAGELKFEESMYWRVDSDGDKDGPFCSACWDQKKQLVRMHQKAERLHHCPTCKTDVVKPSPDDGKIYRVPSRSRGSFDGF